MYFSVWVAVCYQAFVLQLCRALCHFYTTVCDIMCSVYHSNDWELIPTEATPSSSRQNEWDYILRHLNVFLVDLPSLNWLHGDTMCIALSWLYYDTDDLLVPIIWWNLQWSDVIYMRQAVTLFFLSVLIFTLSSQRRFDAQTWGNKTPGLECKLHQWESLL
jgi:hypothetical protein